MARPAALLPSPSPPGILKLPTELLCEIASPLTTSDLRRLSRVNHEFYFFIRAYLIKYRYNEGFVTLPNEIILQILQYVDTRTCSRLARTSQRFYPVVMNYVVRDNIRFDESSLLLHAAKRNLKKMAKNVLRMGGDVNKQSSFRRVATGQRATPLATAAYSGHERMVRLFLASGAKQIVDDTRLPLALAMVKRHEDIVILLSQRLKANRKIFRGGGTLLDFACENGFVRLTRHLLARNVRHVNSEDVRDRSKALYNLLDITACKGNFVKRELLQDVHQIANMLLSHEADPDMPFCWTRNSPTTVRDVASRHPDPRLRNLLSIAKPTNKPKQLPLRIGRSALDGFEDETAVHRMFDFRSMVPPGHSRFATLSDFLDMSDADFLIKVTDDSEDYLEVELEDHSLDSRNLAQMVASDMRGLTDVKAEALAMSSFPQLGKPMSSAGHADQAFWARIPASAKFAPIRETCVQASVSRVKQAAEPILVDPFPQLGRPVKNVDETFWSQVPASAKTAPSIPPLDNPCAQSCVRTTKPIENPVTLEPFPQLGRPLQTPSSVSKEFWASFPENGVSPSTGESQGRLASDAGIQDPESSTKKTKKKQWVPLTF